VSAPVAILGVGVIGGRAARELVSGDSIGVALGSSREQRRAELERAFGSAVSVSDIEGAVSRHTRVVVLSGAGDDQVRLAARHLADGRHVITTVDLHDDAAALLALDETARAAGRTLLVGCCFSPGLSDLLAAHAGRSFDTVDEVHVARHGAAGPRCEAHRRGALVGDAHVLRSGVFETERAGGGRELFWFPDPLGGRDSFLAGTAEPLLAKWAIPTLQRASARLTVQPLEHLVGRLDLPRRPPGGSEGGVGAIRVEVRGLLGGSRHSVVLGVLDRPGVASAALIADLVVALLEPGAPCGAITAGSLVAPGTLLRSLRRRGVRVAELVGHSG